MTDAEFIQKLIDNRAELSFVGMPGTIAGHTRCRPVEINTCDGVEWFVELRGGEETEMAMDDLMAGLANGVIRLVGK